MEIIHLIILGAVYLGLIGLVFLIWAIKTGQFEDMEGPKYRILFDEESPRPQGEGKG
ncbi:MAG: cbb3-type cytochrome oxidase assembly protein CcoS [Deltaproteobacteria bacterium]|nr:cbb3-type cytochrome oxidase assembly protein CcoS [Deltaproteobacteria bacterium]